tara:strand:+ start:439 stop:762 length:324 start_codon:yes stop_codon:yes gene_type:complete
MDNKKDLSKEQKELLKRVKSDIDSGFQMTDEDDGHQRMKKISESTFHYRCEFHSKTIKDIIDVGQMDATEQEEAIWGFYESLSQVKEIYGNDANQIIAECFFENSLL